MNILGIEQLFFDVFLTVHLSITLANDQLDAQIFNTFTRADRKVRFPKCWGYRERI
jgi:hypothetical protein